MMDGMLAFRKTKFAQNKAKNLQKIDNFLDLENFQICHIQIAAKTPEVFEYAVSQVRDHVARQYGEYIETCIKTDSRIIVQSVAVAPYITLDTAKKLGLKLQHSLLNTKAEIERSDLPDQLSNRIQFGNTSQF